MLYRLAHVRTDVSEELSTSMIRVVPSSPILVTLLMEVLSFSKTLILIRATWHNIPEDGILDLNTLDFSSYLDLASNGSNYHSTIFWNLILYILPKFAAFWINTPHMFSGYNSASSNYISYICKPSGSTTTKLLEQMKVYFNTPHTILYLNAKSHHHPSNKRAILSTLVHRARALCDDDSLQAELVFQRNVFKQNGCNGQRMYRALNCHPNFGQLDNKSSSVTFLPFVRPIFNQINSVGPTQHQVYGLAPYEIMNFPLSCQRQTRTKDTGCLQEPL
jgi:hypothetical protein